MFGFLREIGQLVEVAGGDTDHRGVLSLELGDCFGKQVRFHIAARGMWRREEVDHHRALLQRVSQFEGEGLAGEIGRCGKVRRLGAFLQSRERR